MKIAAIYARVSTQRQAEEATIESQIAQIEQYAQANGFAISAKHRFSDEAISGKQLHRPGLNQLRDAAVNGVFTTILCLSPDRLSRNLGVQQLLLSEWRQLNIEVIFVQRPNHGQTASDNLLLNIEGAFAEYERTVISDRMQRGRRYRLQQGQSVPYPAPYGYHYQPATAQQGSHWQIDPAQALVVEQIFVWYTCDGLTTYAIAQRLNDSHPPAPDGDCWYASAVNRILCQSAYRGMAYYGRTYRDYSGLGQPRKQGAGRLQYPRGQIRPAEEWIAVSVPVIIDEVLWQQAQEKRNMNSQTASRNSQRTYLLRGLLVCDVCRRPLQGRAQQGQTYYRCPGGGKNRPDHVPAHTTSVRADTVETAVWLAVADLLRHPDQLQQAWEDHRAAQNQTPSQVARWQQRQKKLRRQRQRLLDAYQAGILTLPELTERQNPLVLELRQLETQLAAANHVASQAINVQAFMAQITRALDATDVQTKQQVIRLLIEQVVVNDNELIIEHIVPLADNSQLEPTQCSA